MQGRIVIAGLIGAAALVAGLLWLGAEPEPNGWATLETVCTDCHNDIDLAGDVSLTGMTPESIAEHPEVFETVVQRLRGRLMPPPGGPVVETAALDALIHEIETELDRGADARVGHVRAQRLSRTEYAHAIEGLLGVKIDAAEFLPTEIEVEGFTNIASALSVSPSFVEQYVNVAQTVAALAVGDPAPRISALYVPPPDGNQTDYIDGFPLGTRGGMKFTHSFPADGEYRLSIKSLGVGAYPTAQAYRHTLVVLVNGVEHFRESIGGEQDFALANAGGAPGQAEIMARFSDIPLSIDAGVHEITITFIARSDPSSDWMVGGGRGGQPVPNIADGIDLVGPYEVTGLSRTASRERIFVCEPEVPARERECAEQIAADLAGRAFRRPAMAADLDRLMPFYETARNEGGGFDEGIEMLVAAVISSPDFLYRTITPEPGDERPTFPLDNHELATRLSFFLWSRGPDDELLALANRGALTDADMLAEQTSRMLADSRATALVENFALAWLDVDELSVVEPDPDIFRGQFSAATRANFAEEIRRFVASILLEERDVRELLTADHTFVNEALARHYGIEEVRGPQFRRVELADPVRRGLLGKGAVQLMTSYGDRTSPVLRGAWVLEKLMGTPPTPPPPGVETDLTTPEGEEPKTVRARLEQHRANPNCGACHGVIDPWGLALENFDVTGRWRDVDRAAGVPIDASTTLPGGRTIDGPVELVAALQSQPDQFVHALTEKLMTYALGRELEYYDMPTVRKIVREAADDNYRFAAIVAGIVASDAFRMQLNRG